jgi:hypothetical protein
MSSADHPITDIAKIPRHVRFVPCVDIQEFGSRQKKNPGTLPGVSLSERFAKLSVDAEQVAYATLDSIDMFCGSEG